MTLAVLCAGGLGDGLLMMITANQMQKTGRKVTVFHNLHKTLSPLFPTFTIVPYPKNLLETLQNFDEVILQNDNSKTAWEVMENRNALKKCVVFFPTKSRMVKEGDFLFPKREAIGKSIARATSVLLSQETQFENGLFTPDATFKKHPSRIVIHPTSADPKRNWKPSQFIRLAKKLMADGYLVSFAMAENETPEWQFVTQYGISLPIFKTLQESAKYIYESGYLIGNDSGLGHLASNLGIPTLTISGNPKRVAIWRPAWSPGKVATLSFDLPNFKGIHFRFREHFWQYFISMRKVYKRFRELVNET